MLIQSLQSKEEGRKKETCDFDVWWWSSFKTVGKRSAIYLSWENLHKTFLTQQTKEEEQQHAGFLGATVEIYMAWDLSLPPSHIIVFISHVIIGTLFKVHSVCIQRISKFLFRNSVSPKMTGYSLLYDFLTRWTPAFHWLWLQLVVLELQLVPRQMTDDIWSKSLINMSYCAEIYTVIIARFYIIHIRTCKLGFANILQIAELQMKWNMKLRDNY